MQKEIVVYKYDKAIATQKEKIKSSDMTEAEKDSIFSFVQYIKSESRDGMSPGRIVKTLYSMQILRSTFNLSLASIGEENVKAVVAAINDSKYAAWSKHDFKSILKRFIRFKLDKTYNPEDWKYIKVKMSRKDKQKVKLREEELLSVEEVEKMISVCNSTRDKALLAVAYESGCRPSEYLTLKYGDVAFDKHGAVIKLRQSKTFTRDVRLVNAAPFLRAWCNTHPSMEAQDPLWIAFASSGEKRAVGLATLRKTMMIVADKAGICKLENPSGRRKKIVITSGKQVYPYLFRHSRITHMLRNPKYSLALVKNQVGWDEDTMQISTYQHLSNESFDEMALQAHGIVKEGDSTPVELETRLECFNCKELNAFDSKVCHSCGFPIQMGSMTDFMTKMKQIAPLLPDLLKLASMNGEQLAQAKREMKEAKSPLKIDRTKIMEGKP